MRNSTSGAARRRNQKSEILNCKAAGNQECCRQLVLQKWKLFHFCQHDMHSYINSNVARPHIGAASTYNIINSTSQRATVVS